MIQINNELVKTLSYYYDVATIYLMNKYNINTIQIHVFPEARGHFFNAIKKKGKSIGLDIEFTKIHDPNIPFLFDNFPDYIDEEDRELEDLMDIFKKDTSAIYNIDVRKEYKTKQSGILNATSQGCFELIRKWKTERFDNTGINIGIIGRGTSVGYMDLAHRLVENNDTLVLCHSHTLDTIQMVSKCDIIVSCLDDGDIYPLEMFKDKSVIDIGYAYKDAIHIGTLTTSILVYRALSSITDKRWIKDSIMPFKKRYE